jgi:haloalkane dehalogenase
MPNGGMRGPVAEAPAAGDRFAGPARPAWVPDALYPFEDHWAEIEGNLVHYVDEGRGRPLLLLNGNPSWSFGWRDVIRGVRGTFRCIAPDYPGFGLSRAAPGADLGPAEHSRVVEALVDRLGLREVIVFGYAWGGPIGLGFAGRRPELVGGLVIGNTWAWPDDRIRARLFGALMGGPLSPLLVDRLNLMLRLYLPLGLKRGGLTPVERAAYEGPFAAGGRSAMRALPRGIVRSRGYLGEVEANLSRLRDTPAIILWPDSDPGFGDAELARWRTLFPAARTVSLERTGQFIDEDAPDDIAAALVAWAAADDGPGLFRAVGQT